MRLHDAGDAVVLGSDAIDRLVEALRERGHETFGPVRTGTAIVFGPIDGTADLPTGWTDEQEPGSYRLRQTGGAAHFGWAVGPESLKRYLFPPSTLLFRADSESGSVVDAGTAVAEPAAAFIGVRPCDAAAAGVLDPVFAADGQPDPTYVRRRDAFLVVVNCTTPGGTCFCDSMGTGPEAETGADIFLTELVEPSHRFLARAGTPRGEEVLAEIGGTPADEESREDARQAVDHAAETMGRVLDTDGLRDALVTSPRHPRWESVADRCLACTNCTDVCPTCFCHDINDSTDLAGSVAERTRVWDSCFSLDHSYIHGGSVRATVASRYRQWLTHKFGTWHDQFGRSGCVGCGRCITWCPVGIDVTEELAAVADSPSGTPVTIGGT